MVRLVATLKESRNTLTSCDINEDPRSEWTYAGAPNTENNSLNDFITEIDDVSCQGNANGNGEYSSTAITRDLFLEVRCIGR